MKKISTLFSIVFVLACGYSYAQTSQGNIMLGGGFRIQSDKQETAGEDVKTSTVQFIPSAGYFLADDLALGLNLGIFSQTQADDDKLTRFAFGPFARYYKYTSNENFAFFGEVGFLFGSEKFEPDGADEVKGSNFTFYISPGFSYFFNEKWALDLQLQGISYESSDPNKDGDDDKQSSFIFGVESFNPSLGFRYIIGE
jgi:outer membrane protein